MSRTPRPAADVRVDPELVRALVRGQFPQLAGLEVRFADDGWDNAIYRLGTDLLVRLPRRLLSSQLVLNEQRWLPGIARRVTVDIPVPVRAGEPTEFYPWPWSVTPWFPGLVVAGQPRAQRADLAEPLAAFLADFAEAAPDDAPENPWRGVPLVDRDVSVRERLTSGLVPDADAASRLWDRALSQPVWAGPRLWVHGDLHPANLVAVDGALGAVLDFGDLTAGDPATDLAAAWLVFDERGRARFRDAIDRSRDIDAATWIRAEGWALCLATALLTASDDSPVHRRIGEETLAELLAGD